MHLRAGGDSGRENGVMVGSVGYGFDADNINGRGLLEFMEKYAADDIGRITKYYLGMETALDGLPKPDMELICDVVKIWVSDNYRSVARYIAGIVCKHTCEDLFESFCEQYVVYPPPMFPDDAEEKRRFVRNGGDVRRILTGFFPEQNIHFGYICINTSACIHTPSAISYTLK